MNNFFTFLFAFSLGVTAQQIMASGRLDTSLVVPLLLSLFCIVFPEVRFLKDRKQIKALKKLVKEMERNVSKQ